MDALERVQKALARERRAAEAVAHGRCVRCYRRKVEPGKRSCKLCLRDYRQKRKRAMAAGKCGVCKSRPALPNRTRCAECGAMNRAYASETYLRKKRHEPT